MDKRTIGYWISTGLIALLFMFGGVVDLLASPEVVKGLGDLGYPPYFARILGVWKVLGAIALLAPGLPRLKEWAYAGIFFDLTSASVSHAASGDELAKVVFPLVVIAVLTASWWLRPASRTLGVLGGKAEEPAAAPHLSRTTA